MSSFARVRSALRPFVHRSLRGRRLRRVGTLSSVIAILTVLLGWWLAVGDGPVEREARQALQLERPVYERAALEFREFTFDDAEHLRMTAAYDEMVRSRRPLDVDDDRTEAAILRERTRGALILAGAALASWDPDKLPEHTALVASLRSHQADLASPPPTTKRSFNWHDARELGLLRRVAEDGFVPVVTRYRSPLSVPQAIGVVGALACGLLALLLTVVGPVLVGIAVATEMHENTLQPLSGSSLTSREIALGLVAGALAPVGLLAAPLLGIACIAASIAGTGSHFPAFVALLLTNAFATAMVSLTIGLHAGRRRGPGAVGMSLLAVLATWGLVGLPLGFAPVGADEAAALTVLQSGGMVHLVRDALLGGAVPTHWALAPRFAAGAFATLVVAILALRAAERRIPGRFVPSLHPLEAIAGAATLTAVTMVAASSGRSIVAAWATMAAMMMPLQVLLMARVPTGDAPAGRVRVGLGPLALEYASWVALHLGAMMVVFPAVRVHTTWWGAAEIAWALGIAGLAALRVVAVVARLPAMIMSGAAFLVAIAAFVHGVQSMRAGTQLRVLLTHVDPWLTTALAGLAVVIPVVLAWPLLATRPRDAAPTRS